MGGASKPLIVDRDRDRTRRSTGPERVDRLRERLIGKLSDTMDPDNAREMVDEFEREVRWEEQ